MSVVKEICSHVAILDNGTVKEEGLVGAVFAAPKSEAARRLVFPGRADKKVSDPASEQQLRLVFRDDKTTAVPLVARLAQETGVAANVISATTQMLSDEVYGSMLVGVPKNDIPLVLAYLSQYPAITVEEVSADVQ